MRELVIDLETSIKNRDERGKAHIGNNKASPHWPDNDVVVMGVKEIGVDSTPWIYKGITSLMTEDHVLVIGHNIKFDMLYLLRDPLWQEAWDKGQVQLWDTQLVEYILTGQTQMYPSLDWCCERRGWELKDDRIKEFWQENIDTEDIPEDMLEEYLIHDVNITTDLYRDQLKEVDRLGMTALVSSMNEALAATTEMEWNGMKFDRELALSLCAEEVEKLGVIEEQLVADMRTIFPPTIEPQPGSNKHVGVFLFGGVLKYTDREIMTDDEAKPIRFKSGARKGEIRTRNVKKEWSCAGMHHAIPEWKTATGWKVDDEVMKTLGTEFANNLLTFRALSKDINTYYIGYSELVFPDGLLHGNLNHCSTGTGRLSSTNPNLQNISNGE
jgi:DNA polymerase I-like protein with 3'-5' exonuclease and polymerase domains